MESFRLQQIPLDLIGWKALQNLDACQVLVQPEKKISLQNDVIKTLRPLFHNLWPFQSLVLSSQAQIIDPDNLWNELIEKKNGMCFFMLFISKKFLWVQT